MFSAPSGRCTTSPNQSVPRIRTQNQAQIRPQTRKKAKKGESSTQHQKNAPAPSEAHLVLNFGVLPAARRDFASLCSAKVRRAAVSSAACCCVWWGGGRAAAPAPSRRPAASGQRSSAPPAQPCRLFLRCRCLPAAGGRGSGASSFALCADGFASAAVALSGLCALPFCFSALVAGSAACFGVLCARFATAPLRVASGFRVRGSGFPPLLSCPVGARAARLLRARSAPFAAFGRWLLGGGVLGAWACPPPPRRAHWALPPSPRRARPLRGVAPERKF